MRIGFFCVTMTAAIAAGGCSKFESDWRSKAVQQPLEGDDLAGRWKGSWKSQKSGHSGSLRCIVTKLGEDTYKARFDASWALLMRFGYEMKLTPDRRDDVSYVSGEENIGDNLGGVYEYDGRADGKVFRCNYRTKMDYGYFRLTRPR
jgi:hypothetical protein